MKRQRKDETGRIILEGSTKGVPEAVRLESLNLNDPLEVTVRIRQNQPVDSLVNSGKTITYEEYRKKHGISDDDIRKMEDFAHRNRLTIVNTDRSRRSMILKGKVLDFEEAFHVHLSLYRDSNDHTFVGRIGNIRIPEDMKGIIEGVFGLDNRPHSRAMFQIAKMDGMYLTHDSKPDTYTPNDVARMYGFPKDATGENQCIGIIELGGGYRTEDLERYFDQMDLNMPNIKAVSVDGGYNNPSTPDSHDANVMTNIEVAGSIAPDANIVIYFAPNTVRGFLDAITTAIHDTQNMPSVISIGWGTAEKFWTQQSLNTFNQAFKAAAALGITVCAASGDRGSADNIMDGRVHTVFPASSPYVLACGGTSLKVDHNKIVSETVWNDLNMKTATGGGISDFFPVPDYQMNIQIPKSLNSGFKGRGLPDVAADADPNTGYRILVDGDEMVAGGTSTVAPLMSALIALVNQQKNKRMGFINPTLYKNHEKLCREITKGDNITTTTKMGYVAGPGWNACTGLGVLSRL